MTRMEQIKARLTDATGGPWNIGQLENCIATRDGAGGVVLRFTNQGTIPGRADRDFIAHSREDIPYLLDQYARAHALVEDLKGYVLQWQCPEPCDHPGCSAHRTLLARADAFLEDKA